MEGFLVMLVIFLLSGLANWLQKKQREQSEAEAERALQQNPPSAQPPTDAPRRPQVDWQRELRRLLEPDEEIVSPRPISRPFPPVIVQKETPPLVSAPAPRPVPQAPPTKMAEETSLASVGALAESRQAYARAQQLHEAAMVRVQKVVEQTMQHAPAKSARAARMQASDLFATVAMLKHPQAIRRGLILTTILGTPKALEEEAFSSR